MHEHRIDSFFICRNDIQHAVQLGYFNELEGMFRKARQDKHTAILLENTIANEESAETELSVYLTSERSRIIF